MRPVDPPSIQPKRANSRIGREGGANGARMGDPGIVMLEACDAAEQAVQLENYAASEVLEAAC